MALNPVEVVGGIAIGEGVGGAVAAVVEPQLQDLKNSQWQKHADKPLDAEQAALAAIKGFATSLDLAAEAAASGYDGARFGVLEQNLRVFPATAQLLHLWRRKQLTQAEVEGALHHEGIPDPYRTALLNLFNERLDPAVIATAIQRGIMSDPGFLPVGPPTGTGKVPKFPVSPLDPLTEAEDAGIDKERLFVETAIVGLPASPDLAARMTFRDIIDKVDFRRAIAEGNTRNEWADALFEGFREIPTAHNYVEARLRGWIDDKAMYDGTARHGMSPADTDLLLKDFGRPLSFHQVFIGERRGGVYDGPTSEIDPAFLKSLRESNIRPEWYNLAWAQRYTYPSAFVLRALTQAGDLTQAQSEEILLKIGWPPELAKQVSTHWAGGAAATVGPLVKSYHNRAVTTVHKAYLTHEIDAAQAEAFLSELDAATQSATPLISLWDVERTIPGAGLSRAQIKKAYKDVLFSRDEAIGRLTELGMPIADANTYLDE